MAKQFLDLGLSGLRSCLRCPFAVLLLSGILQLREMYVLYHALTLFSCINDLSFLVNQIEFQDSQTLINTQCR